MPIKNPGMKVQASFVTQEAEARESSVPRSLGKALATY